jgi:mannosyltransferase OCH1-like enzyme
VKRLQILLSEGGITLDSDTFVVSKLNDFFNHDCTIGWPKNQNIGNQVGT